MLFSSVIFFLQVDDGHLVPVVGGSTEAQEIVDNTGTRGSSALVHTVLFFKFLVFVDQSHAEAFK